MRNFVAVMVLGAVVGLGMGSQAQSKKSEKQMPAMIPNATWVLVRTMIGDQYTPSVTQEDRKAIAEVQQRIQDWGHYKLAYKEKDADIIIVVRRGVAATLTPEVIIGAGSGQPTRPGVGMATEMGPNEDMFAVYDAHFGIDNAPLWRRLQKGGLLNEMPLFKEFKKEVEAAKKP